MAILLCRSSDRQGSIMQLERCNTGLFFSLLGTPEILAASRRINLKGARQQSLAAMLSLDAGNTVGASRLIEGVWGGRPPATADAQLRICVSRLRRRLAEAGVPGMISTDSHGYRLAVRRDQVDVHRFTDLLAMSREAEAEGDCAEAVRLLRTALGLWRGPAARGLTSPLIRAAAMRLDEERVGTLEHCFGLEIRLGRHHQILPELMAHADEYPFRERIQFQLLTALYRSGRQVDALHTYRKIRKKFTEELGIEPSHLLRILERKILTQSPELSRFYVQEARISA
ncbi:transcriptional regulator [Streptomyces sp. p1417]|uniref:Transcriptional regulator n=1 Tax=Streptomyces typhae TaxID=2681492 RepID=A0A6L6X298_9ACTN|nr:AfsR/SARP family transcriptional regulator [Streptomyces typhae]MVO87807.1 transcriptional regulator [Streptomyces typhae]